MELVSASHLSAVPQPLGKVFLIGAGPGDPELLTLKAWRVLQQADVVLYDALVSAEILALLPEKTERIAVGKRAGCHSAHQTDINRLLVTKAHLDKVVVRLKGGDPFVFGRGGEELLALVEANIPFEVIPGITAAVGAAAYAGIPLTHRGKAQSVSFITGHANRELNLDWSALAQANHTLVVYMGLSQSGYIQSQLLQAGRNSDTPVALIANATTSQQLLKRGRLSQLSSLAQSMPKQQPVLLIIGEVTELSDTLNWFHPLSQSSSSNIVSKEVHHA